jgi:pimeloyl-ACP methyl ester carboxylesterase
VRDILRYLVVLATLASFALTACDDGSAPSSSSAAQATATARPIPPKVDVSPEPQGISLADPAFDALPGATAHFGRLGGAVYQIEMPDEWNGRLVLYMHGFQGLAPEASVDPPGIRSYLIRNGFAWGASSYSSTSLIPGRAADETAALWDEFVERFGRPAYTYVTGHSMGGAASHIAAERYADRYDGVVALCGFAGQSAISEIIGDYFFAGAYVAGVTQEQFDSLPIDRVINELVRPALNEPAAHDEWVHLLNSMTGGARAHDVEGFVREEATNWERAQILLATGLSYNAGREYALPSSAGVSTAEFNAGVLRKQPAREEQLSNFNKGNEITGDLQIPMLTMHTTGDWQVPVNQQQILRQAVDDAGKGDLLVQRIVREPSHCAFLDSEWEQGLEDLIAWVERGTKPEGEDVMTDDLRQAGATFTRAPRLGSPEAAAVDGANERVTVSGRMTLDGDPLVFAFVWAEVVDGGLRRLCAFDGPSPSADGRYERVVVSEREAAGCGAAGRSIRLAAATGDKIYFSGEDVAWPEGGGEVTLDVDFTSADAGRAEDNVTPVFGSVLDSSGKRLAPGARIEAYIGDTLCGIGALPHSVLAFQNPDTFDVLVASPDAIPGCARDATITIKVNGVAVEQAATNDLGDGVLLDLIVN